jgi:hypothetical protein
MPAENILVLVIGAVAIFLPAEVSIGQRQAELHRKLAGGG